MRRTRMRRGAEQEGERERRWAKTFFCLHRVLSTMNPSIIYNEPPQNCIKLPPNPETNRCDFVSKMFSVFYFFFFSFLPTSENHRLWRSRCTREPLLHPGVPTQHPAALESMTGFSGDLHFCYSGLIASAFSAVLLCNLWFLKNSDFKN